MIDLFGIRHAGGSDLDATKQTKRRRNETRTQEKELPRGAKSITFPWPSVAFISPASAMSFPRKSVFPSHSFTSPCC